MRLNRSPLRLFARALALAAALSLSGCLNLPGKDPAIPEQQQIVTIPVYAHSADFKRLSGELFKPFPDEPHLGLAFSREKGAPYGGYFYLESDLPLSGYLPGDRVTVEGRIVEERFAPWQDGRLFQVTRIAPTFPVPVQKEWEAWPY